MKTLKMTGKHTPVLSAAAAAAAFSSTLAFAYADIGDAVNSLFGIGNSAAQAFANGFRTIITPVAIAVGLYNIVRMLLASDSRDVLTYRKRLIFCIAIVIVAVAMPAIVAFMEYVGTQFGDGLNAARN